MADPKGELKGDARLPRYQRLAETLRDEVVGRRWKPGAKLKGNTIFRRNTLKRSSFSPAGTIF